jgi:hypothetical protein
VYLKAKIVRPSLSEVWNGGQIKLNLTRGASIARGVQTNRFNWFRTEPFNFRLFGLFFRFKNFDSVENFS